MKDLSHLKAPQGAKMLIEDPRTNEPLVFEIPAKTTQAGQQPQMIKVSPAITLLGPDSNEYQQVTRKITDRKLQKQINRGRKKIKVTAAELEEDQLELLVACTTGWENIWLHDQELEFNTENVRRLYKEVPAIREQVDTFLGDRGNFLGN